MDNVKNTHENDVLIKRLIDGIDAVHLEKDDRNRLIVNVGEATKDKKYDDLSIYLRYGRGDAAPRLASVRGGNYAIVIDVSDDTKGLKDLLSSKDIFSAVDMNIEKYKQYSDNHEDYSEDEEDNVYDLDSQYRKLIDVLNADLMEVKDRIENIAKRRDETADPAKSTTLSMAIDMVINQEFGSSPDEFVKKTLKKDEAHFSAHLDKQQKDLLSSKLRSYYNNKIAILKK